MTAKNLSMTKLSLEQKLSVTKMIRWQKKIPIVAEKTGYFFKIKSDDILKELDGIKAELTITKKIGEYTTKDESLGDLKIFSGKKLSNEQKEVLRGKISQLLVINIFNNSEEDYPVGLSILQRLQTWL